MNEKSLEKELKFAHLWVGWKGGKACADFLRKENIPVIAIPCSGMGKPQLVVTPHIIYYGLDEIKKNIEQIKEYFSQTA